MKYLLDTHTILWHLENNPLLPAKVKVIINNKNHLLMVSIVSFWEMAIKYNVGKLTLFIPLANIIQEVRRQGFTIVDRIDDEYILEVANLPLHHRDPFDRLLIAQSMVENSILLSADEQFDKYDIQRIW